MECVNWNKKPIQYSSTGNVPILFIYSSHRGAVPMLMLLCSLPFGLFRVNSMQLPPYSFVDLDFKCLLISWLPRVSGCEEMRPEQTPSRSFSHLGPECTTAQIKDKTQSLWHLMFQAAFIKRISGYISAELRLQQSNTQWLSNSDNFDDKDLLC